MKALPAKLSRYSAVAVLLLKYGRAKLTPEPALVAAGGGAAERDVEEQEDGTPEELARDLEQLGPTFIKLGQLLAGRSDLLAPPYVEALSRLQDRVEPFPFEEVERIVEEELGVRLSKAFSHFEATPIASASLGQVHRAALREGRRVAVKVQRPGIVDQVAVDLDALEEVAGFLARHTEVGRQFDVVGMVEEFRRTLLAELDYRREGANLRLLARHLAEFPEIVIPEPVDGYTTSRVLTMDYVRGAKITALSPVARLDVDGDRLAEALVQAYLKQILIDGVFHADPHPGNVFLTDDGRIALIDLGMVGRLSHQMQDRLLKLLLAATDGRGEQVADLLIDMGRRADDFDEAAFRRHTTALVGRCQDQTLESLQVGKLLLDLNMTSGREGLQPPAELTLLGKTLLNLDQIARALSPNLDVNAAIRENSASLLQRRLTKSASGGGVVSSLLEAKEFAERLPGRVNRVLDALSSSELKLKMEMIDEGSIIDGLQKVANRITLGLILASLIIGAAMMMQIDTSFRLLGYPGVAMILFSIAGTGGLWLAAKILANDRPHKRR